MRKGEQTRQEIIRRAAPIFNQKGYHGAALSDLIARPASKKGESTGTLKASKSLREKPSSTLGRLPWMRVLKEPRRFRMRLTD